MNNDKVTEGIEARADVLAEEILVLYVINGMKAKDEVKQLLIRFATDEIAGVV